MTAENSRTFGFNLLRWTEKQEITCANTAYSLWRVNDYLQGFSYVASFGFGGQESASKPPQAICKPLVPIAERQTNMIKKLFGKRNEKWSGKSRKEKYQALQYAVISDDYYEIKSRVNEGIDINLTEENGDANILMYYTQNWRKRKYDPTKYVQLLIDLGINLNHKRNENMKNASALNYAVGTKSIAIVKALVENGAEIDIKELNGNTPLWRAVQEYRGEPELLEIIKYLLDKGANYNEENSHGHSPRSIVDRRHFNITEGSMKNDPNWKNWNLKPLLEK